MHAPRLLTLAGASALLMTTALGGLTTSAQEATPAAGGSAPHPVHIHSGNCAELGEVIAPLTELTLPEGDRVGQRNRAATGATSYTNVPLSLDAILADDHAINAHLSADQIDVYIACGEIGGIMAPDGSLTIGLRSSNDSGYTGIAYLVPGADGASTDITVFLAETEGRGRGGENRAATDANALEVADDTAAADSATTPDTMDGMDMGDAATPAP
ncbi:MAG: hypothetical protein KC442_24550 [Thermomicrobiales bacterium]|nr:hypothetical protein [Thermomicrobiales bacterium]